MTNTMGFLPEPLLRFGLGQLHENPRDGLSLFGPLDGATQPKQVSYGVIATDDGARLLGAWIRRLGGYIAPAKVAANHTAFWGFEDVFRCTLSPVPKARITLNAAEISKRLRYDDHVRAVFETVSLFADAIADHRREEEVPVDFWYVVVPEEVHTYGRVTLAPPKAERISTANSGSKTMAKAHRSGQSFLFAEDTQAASYYDYEANFHNQLKARLLKSGVVIQIVRESTIESTETGRGRRLEDPATIAWKLSTATYFKSGGKPWQLANMRDGVCYVGLVYKKDGMSPAKGNACVGAQMFLDNGDGYVFRGAVGPWWNAERREFHLAPGEAESLARSIVAAYIKQHSRPPDELFLHAQTAFDASEWAGFRAGVPQSTNLVGIHIRERDGLRAFTGGSDAIMRGSFLLESERKALLWTNGFVPYLNTYPGREVPAPLSVAISQGRADIEAVLRDVFALTKVNYNSCNHSEGIPVTLRFASSVGEVLTAAPLGELPPLPFKHYV